MSKPKTKTTTRPAGSGTITTKTARVAGSSARVPALVTIEVPVAEIPAETYVQRHIDVHLVGRYGGAAQRRALKRLTVGLNESHTTLKCGKHVDTTADAIRWLLEQIGSNGSE